MKTTIEQKKFGELLESCKKRKKALRLLKEACVVADEYGLAAEIREIENNLFSGTPEQKKAIELGEKVELLLRMLDLKVDVGTAWLIYKGIEQFNKKKDKFTLSDSVDLKLLKEKLFD